MPQVQIQKMVPFFKHYAKHRGFLFFANKNRSTYLKPPFKKKGSGFEALKPETKNHHHDLHLGLA